MDRATIAFTAVYLKAAPGDVGFVEELPGVNSQGRTIDEARTNLQRLAKIVFDEERAQAEELLRGKEVVREDFVIPLRSRARAEA
jgi:predicted RNase H-like HicB family nuclease